MQYTDSPVRLSQEHFEGLVADIQAARAHGEDKQIAMLARIDKAFAGYALGRNPINRLKRKANISSIALDMMNHSYMINGETVIFDYQGDLQDGQHRLEGVLRADTHFDTWVIIGVDPRSRDSIDSGIGRSPGDVVSFQRVDGKPLCDGRYEHVIARAARELLVYDNGGSFGGYAKKFSKTQILACIQSNPDLLNAEQIRTCIKISRNFNLSSGTLIALWTAFSRTNNEMGQILMNGLEPSPEGGFTVACETIITHGETVGETIANLRKKLLALRHDKTRESKEKAASCIIMAFNAVCEERELHQFRFGKNWKEDPVRIGLTD